VAIVYNSSSIEVGSSLGFTVDGTTPYDWTITPSADGVASIASGDTATTKASAASITVNGLKAGTFTVSATPSAGGTQLTTGTITVVQTYTLGDVNNDGKINSTDAILVLQHAAKIITLTDAKIIAADINGDGKVNSTDAIKILQYAAKIITHF
jgi:hypothetical protein